MAVNTRNKEAVIHITFHQLDHSEALEQKIHKKAEKLFKVHPFIMDCRIVVNSPHHHKHKGNLYQIRVDINVPGEELVVNKQKKEEHAHENPYIAVSNAFKIAEHLLQQYKEKTHGIIKHHSLPLHGKISKLKKDHGYIETPNYTSVYFHKNSLEQGTRFIDLKEGDIVHFSLVEEAERDLTASLVKHTSRHTILEEAHSIKDIAREGV